MKCTTITKAGHPCKNKAWWINGYCPKHFDKTWTMGDWLNYLNFIYKDYVNKNGIYLHRHISIKYQIKTGSYFTDFNVRALNQSDANYIKYHPDDYKIILSLHIGRRIGYALSRLKTTPDEAEISIDNALACGILSEINSNHINMIKKVFEITASARKIDELIKNNDIHLIKKYKTYIRI